MTESTDRGRLPSRAMIVGGSSGVGLASAVRLAHSGVARIVLVGRDLERGEAARAAVMNAGAEAIFISGDVTRPDEVGRVVGEGLEFLGGIDFLLNASAPQGHMAPLEDLGPADVVEILSHLALPPMLMTRATLPHMKRGGGGSIVSVASDAAKVPTPGEAVAGAGMAAIAMFSRTVALEAKRHRIRVNVVTPSLIAGTRTSEQLLRQEFAAKIFDRIASKAALGVPDAEDLADLVVFLSGPSSSRITGQVISVNGGISAG